MRWAPPRFDTKEVPGEDEAGRHWDQGIAAEWSTELNDLARFPFGDIPGMKLRPVLLLTGRPPFLS